MFQVISTETEVFVFDMEYFGVNTFKWTCVVSWVS